MIVDADEEDRTPLSSCEAMVFGVGATDESALWSKRGARGDGTSKPASAGGVYNGGGDAGGRLKDGCARGL